MAKLVLKFPDQNAPGYLRFMKAAPDMRAKLADLSAAIRSGTMSAGQIDELVDVMLLFTVEPADKGVAREMIFDASADDIANLLAALTAGV